MYTSRVSEDMRRQRAAATAAREARAAARSDRNLPVGQSTSTGTSGPSTSQTAGPEQEPRAGPSREQVPSPAPTASPGNHEELEDEGI